LIYGIPNFKLDKSIVGRRVKRLEEGGIEFVLNCDVVTVADWVTMSARNLPKGKKLS